MFDRLISFIIEILADLKPFYILNEYEQGVRLRLGKYHKTLSKGLHFKFPFVDEIISHHTVWTTINLPPQSLITKDEKNIVVSAVIKFRVTDIKTFLLEVYDTIDAICDMSQSAVKRTIMNKTWEECKSDELDNDISKKARIEARKWGIEIQQITLIDLAQIRSIRLFNDSTHIS